MNNKKFVSDHPRREEMIVKSANSMGIDGDSFEALPEATQEFYAWQTYTDIITPMVVGDREAKGLSYRSLARKYGVTKAIIEHIFCCRKRFILE